MSGTSSGEPRQFHPSWPAFHRRLLARLVWLAPLLVLALRHADDVGDALAARGMG